jgi:hypothetical protein
MAVRCDAAGGGRGVSQHRVILSDHPDLFQELWPIPNVPPLFNENCISFFFSFCPLVGGSCWVPTIAYPNLLGLKAFFIQICVLQ